MDDTTSTFDPVKVFPEFYTNTTIGELAGEPRWTVSDIEKAPIDMRELLDHNNLRGAWAVDEKCLVTLDELTQGLPRATNAAYYLRAAVDGYAVLDIEPSCPPQLIAPLLSVQALYSELSMSGKGYHLLLPLPSNFWDYPVATNKKVLRHRLGYFEILLEHWVTFTRKPLPEDKAPLVGTNSTAWEQLYARLAGEAKEAPTAEIDIDADKPVIPYEAAVLSMIISQTRINKTLEDFASDHSRFEFSVMGSIYNAMVRVLWAFQDDQTQYTDTHKAWLLFLASTKILPARNKHSEMRNGMPLLLNSSAQMIAQRKGLAEHHG